MVSPQNLSQATQKKHISQLHRSYLRPLSFLCFVRFISCDSFISLMKNFHVQLHIRSGGMGGGEGGSRAEGAGTPASSGVRPFHYFPALT